MKICDYCGAERGEDGTCPGCQASGTDSQPASQIVKGEPFHYNGYVIWWLADWAYDTAEYLFYLGDRLVERFTISREVLRMFVPEYESAMPFIWDLFLLAQGEEEVLQVVEQNAVKPATFKMTLMPTPKEEYALGLSYQAVGAAIATGERRLA